MRLLHGIGKVALYALAGKAVVDLAKHKRGQRLLIAAAVASCAAAIYAAIRKTGNAD